MKVIKLRLQIYFLEIQLISTEEYFYNILLWTTWASHYPFGHQLCWRHKVKLRKAELIQRTKDADHIARTDFRRSEFAVRSDVLLEYHLSWEGELRTSSIHSSEEPSGSYASSGVCSRSGTPTPIRILMRISHCYIHFIFNLSTSTLSILRDAMLSAFTVESKSAHSGDTRTNSEYLIK